MRTLTKKRSIYKPFSRLQALLTGPHTTVREDPAFTGAQAAPASGKDGGRQTALKTFFRSKVPRLPTPRQTLRLPPARHARRLAADNALEAAGLSSFCNGLFIPGAGAVLGRVQAHGGRAAGGRPAAAVQLLRRGGGQGSRGTPAARHTCACQSHSVDHLCTLRTRPAWQQDAAQRGNHSTSGFYETQVWVSLTERINEVKRRQRLALSTCVRCHSGGMMGPVACENGWGRDLFPTTCSVPPAVCKGPSTL
jgi:hypothetical protein